jgi:hypothetical protein
MDLRGLNLYVEITKKQEKIYEAFEIKIPRASL